jgi:hypothetical protein
MDLPFREVTRRQAFSQSAGRLQQAAQVFGSGNPVPKRKAGSVTSLRDVAFSARADSNVLKV